ncbi:response regulator transcription factor [bacterium]|nr:response regulator transcription factor [bacterium]
MSLDLLTDRELEVLKKLVKGKSNIEIAKELFISISTVKAHVSSILYKFQARSRSEAAIKAVYMFIEEKSDNFYEIKK